MKEPLIPFDFYEQFIWTAKIEETKAEFLRSDSVRLIFALIKLKYWINELPRINYDTLRLHINVFKMIVKNEPFNRMTAYNMAITVGPSIFRPRHTRPEDITNVGSYYELIIQMILQYDLLFDKTMSYSDIIRKAKDEEGNLLKTKLGADAGVGIIDIAGL